MIGSVLAPLDTFGEGFVNGVVRINDWVQRGLLRRVTVAAILVGAAAFFTFALWPKLEYLPNGNRNLVFGIVLPPPGYNLDELMKIGELVEDELRPYVEVDPDSEQAEQLDYPPIADFFYVARGRQVFVGLRAADPMRAGELVPLVANLRTKLPGTYVIASQSSLFQRGLNAGRSIDIEITGPELPKLVEIGGQIMGQVTPVLEPEKFTGDAPVTPPQTQARPLPSLDLSNPEVQLIPKLVQAAEMGVSATDLGYAVDALVDGAYVTDYFIGGDKIDLVVMGNEIYASRTQDLESLPVATPLSEFPVRLDSLAEVRLSAGPEQINHRERLRAITIQVTPPPNMALEDAIERINAKILDPLRASGQLGSQYTINLSGTADKLRQTWLSMRWILVLALLVTYLLMAALFESWIHPLVIILSVPLGAVGGVLGLKLLVLYQLFTQNVLGFNPQPLQTLDVLTMLGFVILIGTVVNNAILIVHQSLNHMRLDGMMPRPAILESVRTRIRPIFMTTLTTVFGLAPLVFFPGAGSELYRGLGSVVLGGLIVSTIFTLVLVPTMFSLMLDLGEFTRRLLGQATEPHDARAFEEQFLTASAVDGESAEDEGEQSDSDLEPEPQREPELQPEPDSQREPESASKRGPK
jgi:HAE1 family hydrophobic/amphiphilic exporter-1